MKPNQIPETPEKRTRKLRIVLLVLLVVALVALYVVNASIPGKVVEGCPDTCGIASERSDGPLRVLSLNMLHGFPKFTDLEVRMRLIVEEIKRLDADVVILQEVPWTRKTGSVAQVLAEGLGYNYLYYRASGNKTLIFFEEGEAILSRYPLKDVVSAELQPGASYFENRVVLGATAVTPWGEMRLFGTHLSHSDPQVNQAQVGALRSFVEANTDGMGIVAGDFNAWETTSQIKGLACEWTDTYRVSHPDDIGLTCCTDDLNAPPGTPLQMRIDYIFLVHSGWKLISAKHAFYGPFRVSDGWQWASDHTGLIVEIEPK